MTTPQIIRRPLTVLRNFLIWVILMALMSCGTLLYPERRYSNIQVFPKGRQIDPAVAVLDGACLILFIVPGIIAFAVDFATGAIYLPQKGNQSRNQTQYNTADQFSRPKTENSVLRIHIAPDRLTSARLERLVRKRYGYDFHFEDSVLSAFQLSDTQTAIEAIALNTFN